MWSAPLPLTNTAAWAPALGMNAEGAAVVAWTESAGNMWQVAATSRQVTGSGWGSPPTVLRPGDDNGDRYPVVAVSGTGEGFVLWTQDDAAGWISVWMAQHTNSGWQPSELFESYETQNAYSPAIAANKAGIVFGGYIQVNSSTTQIWTRRYAPGAGFAAPQRAADSVYIEWIEFPSLTLDESGTATLAWAATATSTGKYNVFTNRVNGSAAWPLTPTQIETDNAAASDDPNSSIEQAPMPKVGNDAAGNVTLIWRKRTGTRFDLYGTRFPAGGTAWTTPASLLETRDTQGVWFPALGVGVNGTAVATWYYGTELDVYANVYR